MHKLTSTSRGVPIWPCEWDLALRVAHKSINRHRGNNSSIVNRTSRTRLTWSFATDIKPNSNGPPRNGQDPGENREPAEQIESQLGQSMVSPGSCPLRGGPLELGLMSVAELQVSLVRLVRFTMLESLPLRLFVDS